MYQKNNNSMKFISFIFLLSIGTTLCTTAQDRLTGKMFATRSEVIAPSVMAATSHPLATQVALDIMKKGGNAIDAAIAANAALGLMEPTGNGIGGDLFAIIWSAKDQKLFGLNGSGRSPKGLTLEILKEKGLEKIPAFGPLPVSVPGTVDGWFTMHKKFGKLEMKEILNPTIQYARNGFPLTELIQYYWALTARRFKDYPNFNDVYTKNGVPPEKGELMTNPYLANTLELIAKHGRDAFYKGEMAETMATFIQEQGGYLSVEDLANHKSEWVEPVSINYRGYDVWELPPNGQGIAALQILQILEEFDLRQMGFGSADHIHTFTEAKKIAFEDRAKYYADLDFYKTPIDYLISDDYAAGRAKEINPSYAQRSYEPAELSRGETIYLTTADSEGNMVSLIQSNFRGMGSGMVPPDLGFMLQDRGELFSLIPGQANTYAPKKRPFHTIIPAFITKDGKPWVSFGLMGGAMQPQGHAQIVTNLIDFDMNLQEAGDAPRIRHEGSSQPTGEIMEDGGVLYLENGFSDETVRQLLKYRHKMGISNGGYGGYQAIMRTDEGVYIGASESRKDGQAAGY
jgi:gamma-glutamyltranspeptidase/glutathione hydrolase